MELTGPFKRFRAAMKANPVTSIAWKSVVATIGSTFIVIGLLMLVTPGPGWAAIFLGLVILASEFAWASRLVAPVRVRILKAVSGKKRPRLIWFLIISVVSVVALIATYLVYVNFPD
ncbi:MAG: PGPGW domain-containing protein [Candidatus Nanopelagicales bacterium]